MSATTIDLTEYAWKHLTVPSAKHILDQVEKNLAASIETATALTDRAVSVLQFSIPIMAALLGIIFTPLPILVTHLAVIGLILLGLISRYAIKLYELYEVQPQGNKLENMLVKEKIDYEGDDQEFTFLYNSILTTNNSIQFNDNANKKRRKLMVIILGLIKYGSLAFPLYLALWFLALQSLFVVQG